jgi:CRISPR-associated endonuclease/helicase Cas3
MPTYLAHVRRNEDGSFAVHHLEEHLRAVGHLASEFASTFGHADWGHLAGLWHDLGEVITNSITVTQQRQRL